MVSAPRPVSAAGARGRSAAAAQSLPPASFRDFIRTPSPFRRKPTADEINVMVDEQVGLIQQRMLQLGLQLPLARLGPGLYSLGKRKIHLSYQCNRLVVRQGAGWIGFLDWLEKARF